MTFKYAVIVFLLIGIVSSCSKESIKETNPPLQITSEGLDYEGFTNILEGFTEHYAYFKNEKELDDFLYYAITNDSEYDVNYKTLQMSYDNAYNILESAKEDFQFEDFINNNSKLLKIESMVNGDQIMKNRHYFESMINVLNQDCILKVNDSFRFYTEDIFIESQSYEYLKDIKNKEDAQSKGIEFNSAFIILKQDSDILVDRNDLGIDFPPVEDSLHFLINDNQGCLNDRMITINFLLTAQETTIENIGIIGDSPGYNVFGNATVTAYKKIIGLFGCFWVEYKTWITWIDFFCEVEWPVTTLVPSIDPLGNITYNLSTTMMTESWEEAGTNGYGKRKRHKKLWQVRTIPGDFQADWKRIISDATHQGMAGEYLELDESY